MPVKRIQHWDSYVITNYIRPCSLHIKTNNYLRSVRNIIGYACTVWAIHTAQDTDKTGIYDLMQKHLQCKKGRGQVK